MRYLALALSLTLWAGLAAAYTLPYEAQNRWVASAQAKDLRQLVKDAKTKSAHHFNIQLPKKADETLYLSRLEVLRKILERNLKRSVVIEQVMPDIDTDNTIIVTIAK